MPSLRSGFSSSPTTRWYGGVHDLLDVEPGLEVVGEASTAEQALARVPALRPDVVRDRVPHVAVRAQFPRRGDTG